MLLNRQLHGQLQCLFQCTNMHVKLTAKSFGASSPLQAMLGQGLELLSCKQVRAAQPPALEACTSVHFGCNACYQEGILCCRKHLLGRQYKKMPLHLYNSLCSQVTACTMTACQLAQKQTASFLTWPISARSFLAALHSSGSSCIYARAAKLAHHSSLRNQECKGFCPA